MLLVDASAGPSKIHGLGLIAREFIPKGAVIWSLQPNFDRLLTEDVFNSLSLAAQKQVLYYSYFDRTKMMYVLSSDDDRFTNHSESPNTTDVGDQTIAASDIHPGDEITANFGFAGFCHFCSPSFSPRQYTLPRVVAITSFPRLTAGDPTILPFNSSSEIFCPSFSERTYILPSVPPT